METYAGLTKEYYRESLAGFQNQHSRSLMSDTWITPQDILERIIFEHQGILDNWESMCVDSNEDLTTGINE
jgi:hypothetical protein